MKLFQEIFDDDRFCFFFGHTEGAQFDQLFIVDSSDGSLMNDLCINMVGVDFRDGTDGSLIHDDGITLNMGMTLTVADGTWVEDLFGCTLGNGAGDDPCRAAISIQLYIHVGYGFLGIMSHELFCDEEFGIGSQFNVGFTFGGVNAFNLGCLKGENRVLSHIDLRNRIQNLAAGAITLGIVVLDIFDIGIFSHMESVDTVVAGLAAAFTVNTASGYNRNICTVFNEEIIVNHIDARLRHNNRDMYLFILCFSTDVDVNARFILLADDGNMAAVAVADGHTIQSEVVGSFLFKAIGVNDL